MRPAKRVRRNAMIDALSTNGSSPPSAASSTRRAGVITERRDWPTYVVARDGRFLQERAKQVGFHWETTGRAWYRSAKYASKYPRTIARILAVEHGGIAVQFTITDDRRAE
jgi:hypothetical protein